MNPDEPHTLLLVDDDERLRTHLGRALEGRGYDVWTAATPAEALEIGRGKRARACGRPTYACPEATAWT